MTLIERLESAEEGSRELDAEIAVRTRYPNYKFPDAIRNGTPHNWVEAWGRLSGWSMPDPLPHYTTSLDAALSLVPEGWEFEIGRDYAEVYQPDYVGCYEEICFSAKTATPALALCAAAMKARQHDKA